MEVEDEGQKQAKIVKELIKKKKEILDQIKVLEKKVMNTAEKNEQIDALKVQRIQIQKKIEDEEKILNNIVENKEKQNQNKKQQIQQIKIPKQNISQIQGQMQFSQNALADILEKVHSARGSSYMPNQKDKFTVNKYGLREMDPNYMAELKQQRNKKANESASLALTAYFKELPAAQNNSEASSQLSIFNNVMTNNFGQWLRNGELTTFKKITQRLSDVQKRSPIILLMKRIVQLQRAKSMVLSYIRKNKSIQKSEERMSDPNYAMMRQYNQIKNQFKKMSKDSNYATNPDYKLVQQQNLIKEKRLRLLSLNTSETANALIEAYNKQKQVQELYKSIGQIRQKKKPQPQVQTTFDLKYLTPAQIKQIKESRIDEDEDTKPPTN